MRMIGHLGNETDARTFTDYLYVKGINMQVESERDGTWVVWVHAEDEVEAAREYLNKFTSNPKDLEYENLAKKADGLRLQEKEKEEAAAKRYFNSNEVFRNQGAYGMGRLTGVLIGLCVLAWAGREFGPNKDFWNFLSISDYYGRGLTEVRDGQIWRLITPIFIHAPYPMIFHILFNLWWLKDLGSMVEARQGSVRLLILVIFMSVLPNLAQYFAVGPLFGGMSGVVYGLLGYIWMKGKFDPTSGYYLHPTTMAFMMIWFVFGFTGILNIANWVHGVGLAVGLACGYLSAMRFAGRE